MDLNKCTRCKKDLTDFRISVAFNINVSRLKESSVWEEVPNLNNASKEILCYDCFNLFTELMSKLNIKYDPGK